MTHRRTMHRALAMVAVAASLVVGASCSGDAANDFGGDGTEITADVPDPERVLLAAIVLAVGDVEGALSSGVVSPDELDLAASEITGGSLASWWEPFSGG